MPLYFRMLAGRLPADGGLDIPQGWGGREIAESDAAGLRAFLLQIRS
jgi:hypothetical protein